MLSLVLPLLSRLLPAFVPRDLGGIVQSIFGGELDLKAAALGYLGGRLDAQQGRTAATALAQAVLKQVEDAQGPKTPGTVAQRVQIGAALAENAAYQYAVAGEKLLLLTAAQGVLEHARGTAGEAAARDAREAAEAAYVQANINIGRLASGKLPR